MGATVHQRARQALNLLAKAQACLTDVGPTDDKRLKGPMERAAALMAEANRTLWELMDEASRRKGDLPRLHVYGQRDWHGDVRIVGNRGGLESLRNAIDTALASGSGRAEDLFAGDGDAYGASVVLEEREDIWDRMAVPYTDELARENREGAIQPALSEKARGPVVYLGAETERALRDLRRLTDEACREAPKEGGLAVLHESVNWADPRCVRVSIEVDDDGDAQYAVEIEGVDPAANLFKTFVRDRLARSGFPGVDVRTD